MIEALRDALYGGLEKKGDDSWDLGPARDLHSGTQKPLDYDYRDDAEEPRSGEPFLHGGLARARFVSVSGPSEGARAKPINEGVPPNSNAPAWFSMINS
jgi:hypothetical protein